MAPRREPNTVVHRTRGHVANMRARPLRLLLGKHNRWSWSVGARDYGAAKPLSCVDEFGYTPPTDTGLFGAVLMKNFPAKPLRKEGYILAWNDEFESSTLDTTKWLPYYLPQWSSRAQATPNYLLQDGALVLHITHDQHPWCPEFDDGVKASSIQTGLFAGPLGSTHGQLQFNPQLVVREAQTNTKLYTPHYGYVECRAKCSNVAGTHVSLWMIGYEETPAQSGEIALFEVFGKDVDTTSAIVCYGVHPWGDRTLTDEFYRDRIAMDATAFHLYALEWTPSHIDFYVDNQLTRRITQAPTYPLQIMLSIFELPGGDRQAAYPKAFVVDYVRVYQPQAGYGV